MIIHFGLCLGLLQTCQQAFSGQIQLDACFVTDAAVASEEREKAKRVTYGIIYGLSAWGLAKGPGGLGIQVCQAQNLITSFLNHFSGVCACPVAFLQ